MAKIYSALIFFLISINANAASCCGGGQAAASVMIADHLQEWTYSTVLRSDIGQTNNEGQSMMDEENTDQTFTNTIEYKRLFTDRFQGNISLNFIQKESKRLGKNEKSSGLGDFDFGVFYEALTNYSYTEWSPRVFVGTKFIIPFGENNFNSKNNLRTDIRGTGFYKIDLPVVLVISDFKASITPQYIPEQKYLNSAYAFSTSASYTYSMITDFDITSTLQWNYIGQKKHHDLSLVASQYWEISLSPSWNFRPDASVNLNYSDSTLLGKSRNSALYRSVSLGVTLSELL